MRYAAGTTPAFGVTEAERCRVLGQCMDANTLQVLFALTEAIWRLQQQSKASGAHCFVSLESVKQNCQLLDTIRTSHQPFRMQEATCMAAAAKEQATAPSRGSGDVWDDAAVLQYLQTGRLPSACTPALLRRIQ